MPGRFITVEGIEGVGKSTNMKFIEEYCRESGLTAVLTREPGGTPMAERIRSLILDTGDDPLSSVAELLLMFAARAEHLETLIRPALARGETVVCDRFTDATFAYQGGGRGIDERLINSLQDIVQGNLRPDLTLLLDASPEVSAGRIAERDYQDRFEQEKSEFFSRVRAAYLDIARSDPQRVKVVAADQPLEAVQLAIRSHLDTLFAR